MDESLQSIDDTVNFEISDASLTQFVHADLQSIREGRSNAMDLPYSSSIDATVEDREGLIPQLLAFRNKQLFLLNCLNEPDRTRRGYYMVGYCWLRALEFVLLNQDIKSAEWISFAATVYGSVEIQPASLTIPGYPGTLRALFGLLNASVATTSLGKELLIELYKDWMEAVTINRE